MRSKAEGDVAVKKNSSWLLQGRRAVDLFPMLAEAHPDRAEIQVLAQLGYPLLGAGLMSGMLLWG